MEIIGIYADGIESRAKSRIERMLGTVRDDEEEVKTMVLQMIEFEGLSVEEARTSAKATLPPEHRIIHEEILCHEKKDVAQGVGETLEAAFEQARSRVPSGTPVVSEKVKVQPGEQMLTIKAYDEQTARDKVHSQSDLTWRIERIALEKLGRKGFLGLGKTPNSYCVKVFQPAVVEVAFIRTKARIRVQIGPLPSIPDLLNSLKELKKVTSETWQRLKENPVRGEVAALIVLTATFTFLKEKVSDPFNYILTDVKCLCA
ncbi:MAG: hypothetical protein JRI57_11315, partial [Deltaproteobacteria bacterium]|nr:hypothetical protein [Deltaproteobacteria bacterium]